MLSSVSLSLALVFAAAPTEAAPTEAGPARTVLAVWTPPAGDALGTALAAEGWKIIDVSKPHFALTRTVFGIDEPVPSWADGALRADWEQGSRACQLRAGPPPHAGKATAIYCGRDLAQALLQRHLERLAPRGTFLRASVVERDESQTWDVLVVGYRVDEAVVRELSASLGTKDEAVKAVVRLGQELLSGGGASRPREVVRQLPSAPEGADLAASAEPVVARYAALPIPKPCANPLPSALELEGADRTSLALSARWSASIRGARTAAPRQCGLVSALEGRELAGQSIVSGNATLTCGEESFKVNVTAFTLSSCEDALTKKLVEQAFAAWCGK